MARKLPTEKELEQLYHDKGKEAVRWYAWRNALRALPILGRLPLEEVWGEEVTKHVFAVCKVHLLFANVSKSAKFSIASTYARARDRAADADDARTAADGEAPPTPEPTLIISRRLILISNTSGSINLFGKKAYSVMKRNLKKSINGFNLYYPI